MLLFLLQSQAHTQPTKIYDLGLCDFGGAYEIPSNLLAKQRKRKGICSIF